MPKNKIGVSNFIQPTFYNNFECTGDKCPVNCCFEWGVIGWTEEEYEKLKKADKSDELKEKVETSFITTDTRPDKIKKTFQYQIKYTDEGKCPLLSPEGLCMVQKELGAEYLSHTCMGYPRIEKLFGDTIIRSCNLSCNHVVHMVSSDENSMKLEIHKAESNELKSILISEPFTDRDKADYPALNHELDIFNFFYNILSDRSRSIETSVVWGAMAAQKLDEFIQKGQADKIPTVLKALEPQLNDPKQAEKLESAKPNLSLKANFSIGLLNLPKIADICKSVFENGHSSEEKWNEGQKKWDAAYKDKPFAMRNIALNIYISNRLPFRDKTYSLFENYCYFVSEFAVIKFLAAAMSMEYDKNVEETFEISVGYTDRIFSHSMPNFPKIIDYMRSFGVTTPAMLLGIIK